MRPGPPDAHVAVRPTAEPIRAPVVPPVLPDPAPDLLVAQAQSRRERLDRQVEQLPIRRPGQALGRWPKPGDEVSIGSYRAKVLSVTQKRAKQVLLTPTNGREQTNGVDGSASASSGNGSASSS